MTHDFFGYDGRRVLVVGGATGMGAAAAQILQGMGASAVVLDVADVAYPCERVFGVDLADKVSVDAVLDQLDGSFDAVLSCAGIADGSASLMNINFISQRHIIDTLFSDGRLVDGGVAAMISSIGGLGWQAQLASPSRVPRRGHLGGDGAVGRRDMRGPTATSSRSRL